MELDTIVAVATAPGTGGIAVVRLSGKDAFKIFKEVWNGKEITSTVSHTAHLGEIINDDGSVLDQVVATIFKGPRSFTGEDTIEISCHGSQWIQREIVALLIRHGAKIAGRGEFSKRAFLNGRLDLAQAEGIADLIAASSKAAHRLAVSQVSGGFSRKLEELREKLVDLASLLELELDFSEEDVEFADRAKLKSLAEEALKVIDRLKDSYSSGNAFKEGVPVVIAGLPNSGKSTLLNALLDDDRAIVSDIPGTTRDIIEGTREINGVLFRFYDTAGIRETTDTVERLGIDRALERIDKASIVIWMIDSLGDIEMQLDALLEQFFKERNLLTKLIVVVNKIDSVDRSVYERIGEELKKRSGDIEYDQLYISALNERGIDKLKATLAERATFEYNPEEELIVTNERHYESLKQGSAALRRALELIEGGISGDFIAQDIREALHHLGAITGSITTDTLLTTIFSRFCIGK